MVPRFGKVVDDVLRRTQPYLSTDLPPDEERRRLPSLFDAVLDDRELHQEQTSAADRVIVETDGRDGREALR